MSLCCEDKVIVIFLYANCSFVDFAGDFEGV